MSEAAEGAKNSKDATRKRSMALAKYLKNPDGSAAPGTFKDPAKR